MGATLAEAAADGRPWMDYREAWDGVERRVGSGNCMTFTHLGEQWLDAWMEANAFVGCVEHPEPWTVEAGVFSRLSLPLNLQDNQHHAFHAALSARRADAKARAMREPVAQEHNQRRRA